MVGDVQSVLFCKAEPVKLGKASGHNISQSKTVPLKGAKTSTLTFVKLTSVLGTTKVNTGELGDEASVAHPTMLLEIVILLVPPVAT